MIDLSQRLARRRQQHLFRERQSMLSPQGIIVRVDDSELLSFCSNDYLGLANDARVIAAFKNGASHYGVGAGASHLISGHSIVHHQLEQELAGFVGTQAALLFSTGYMANLAIAPTLLGRHDRIYEDKLNHASLLDGARLASATIKRYQHSDTEQLRQLLQASDGEEKLISSDGVFSMDGDLARLPMLMQLAEQHKAWLMIDDAHGLGVIGESGRGSFEVTATDITNNTILVGTLGKGFGTFGAFAAGSSDLIELLIQQARTYIYTTALPPAVAEATRESLRIIQQEPERRHHLQQLISRFRSGALSIGLTLMDSATPIQPVVIGDTEKVIASQSLFT